MVGAPGVLPATAVWLGAPGEPAGRVDSAQLDPRLLSEAGLTSSSERPPLGSGHPVPPKVTVSALEPSARFSCRVWPTASPPVNRPPTNTRPPYATWNAGSLLTKVIVPRGTMTVPGWICRLIPPEI